MLFLLIRILPIIIPVSYFFLLKLTFVFSQRWSLFLLIILLLNFLFFYLLFVRRPRKRVWFLLLYVQIFVVVGFLYSLMLSNSWFINVFLLTWTVIYSIYLEASFNYLYLTEKKWLMELKNISSYIGVAVSFFLAFILYYGYVFLNFDLWFLILIYSAVVFVLSVDRFLAYNIGFKTVVAYSLALTAVLTELFIVFTWWPTSIYVTAILLSLVYYAASSLLLLFLRGLLMKKAFVQYLLFSLILVVLVLYTAQWF